jgi:tetratricopeptide (TPR) repeat protein
VLSSEYALCRPYQSARFTERTCHPSLLEQDSLWLLLECRYIWQDYSEAIETFQAGLAEDIGDASLSQRLQRALQEAEAEASHVSARQKLEEGSKLFEEKNFASCLQQFEAGIAIEVAAQGDGIRTPLEDKLRERLASAQLEQQRGKASASASAADDRIQQGDYLRAVELLTVALALDIEDPELLTQLEDKLATAQSEATSVVQDKLALGERMLKITAWDDARRALSIAVDLLPALQTLQTAGTQQLIETVRDVLAYAEASNDGEQGEKHMRAKNFESAASSFKAGLDRNQQRDQTLNDRLQSSLDAAIAAKLEQDTARERAKALLQEAEALVKDDDTLDAAVTAFEAGVSLRSAINGGTGYTLGVPNPMEECMLRLEQGLAKCNELIVSRDAARKAARELLVDGSLLMDSPNARMSTVIQKFEDGLQQKQHKNDVALNEQLKAALDEAKLRASHAATKASDCLARGKDLMSLRKFTEAIEVFQEGLQLRTQAAGASLVMEQLALGIGDAERGIAMRETSRKTAERLLAEGTSLVVAKDFDMAVACFKDGLLEQTDDEDLTYELEQSLLIANEAIQERSLAREVCPHEAHYLCVVHSHHIGRHSEMNCAVLWRDVVRMVRRRPGGWKKAQMVYSDSANGAVL